jgi:hypothetical protein
MALGVNAGDMKQKLIGMANPVTDTPTLVKTDTKEELQKELTAQLKGWTTAITVTSLLSLFIFISPFLLLLLLLFVS